jgi:Protein of unknown function (DUF3237)
MTDPPPFDSRLVCRITAALEEIQDIGPIPGGHRRVVPIAGGTVIGPLLNGRILPGGADWQILAPDGSAAIEARYTICADDGALILVHSRGVRNGDPAVLARLLAGETPNPSEYYFRTLVTLECSAPAHSWVNGRLFIAVAAREPAAVLIDLHEVL